MTHKEIAAKLGIYPSTVNAHMDVLRERLRNAGYEFQTRREFLSCIDDWRWKMSKVISLAPSQPLKNSDIEEELTKIAQEIGAGKFREVQTAIVLIMDTEGRITRETMSRESSYKDVVLLLTLATQLCVNGVLRAD
jgi:hypothetical protein